MKGIVKMKMFNLPNFLRVDGPLDDSQGLDVGYLFPTDNDALRFWQDCGPKWVEHVAKRRAALSASEGSNP